MSRPPEGVETWTLRMSEAAVEDAARALTDLHGPDQGGDNTLRRLNDAAFVGERYGQALVDDWRALRAALLAEREARERAERMLDDLQRQHEQNADEALRTRTAAGELANMATLLTTRLERAEADRDAAVARADRAEADRDELRKALDAINRVLTTVEGDNYPQGEAPKGQARGIARAALSRTGC